MLLSLYGLAALMVLALALRSLLRDPANPKAAWQTWLFLLLAMALSPITLPNMMRHWFYRHRSIQASHPSRAHAHGVRT